MAAIEVAAMGLAAAPGAGGRVTLVWIGHTEALLTAMSACPVGVRHLVAVNAAGVCDLLGREPVDAILCALDSASAREVFERVRERDAKVPCWMVAVSPSAARAVAGEVIEASLALSPEGA